MRLGDAGAGDAQVAAAVRAAALDEVVAGLPDGLHTRVGEGARRLSAGEAQRVAIARAFLRDAPLVVLDEPTAHLDGASAEVVGAAIERLARGRTTLLVVHREALARRADRVLRLEAGRLVAASAGAPMGA